MKKKPTILPADIGLAHAGYEAYGYSVGWTNYAGDPMPSWNGLPEKQKTAWVEAAKAIRMNVGMSDA